MSPFSLIIQPVAPQRQNNARKAKSPRNRAFTLIEIMIVTLIIGILLSIALPNMNRAREVARQKTCVANLRQIETAKELWAMDNHKANGSPVSLSSLVGVYITPNIPLGSQQPINFFCPSSGLPYEPTIGAVGETPLCPSITNRTGLYAHTLQ